MSNGPRYQMGPVMSDLPHIPAYSSYSVNSAYFCDFVNTFVKENLDPYAENVC